MGQSHRKHKLLSETIQSICFSLISYEDNCSDDDSDRQIGPPKTHEVLKTHELLSNDRRAVHFALD